MGKFNLMKLSSLEAVGIKVINRHSGDTHDAHYVGRGTPLGNVYREGIDGTRKECIRKFRIWLFSMISKKDRAVCAELRRLSELWKKDGSLVLSCSCRPKACHAQVIGAALIWRESIAQKVASTPKAGCRNCYEFTLRADGSHCDVSGKKLVKKITAGCDHFCDAKAQDEADWQWREEKHKSH